MFLPIILVMLVAALNACTPRQSEAGKDRVKSSLSLQGDYELVWSDEFDYTGLPDTSKWSYQVGDGCPDLCGWGNNELQYYTFKRDKNARVEDGFLTIEVHKESFKTREFTSARLATKDKQDWKYGKVQVRAKLPTHKGVWSAIWMLPTDMNHYGGWPNCGEIDIMENVGYDRDTIVGSAHTGAYNHLLETHKSGTYYLKDAAEAFHTYTLDWEKQKYTLSVDGNEFFTFQNEQEGFKQWPFDQKFYLILNIAYGGDWGGSEGIEPEKLPQTMVIDFVRVYQKKHTNEF